MTKIIQGNIFVDDRGPIRFINDFDFRDVKRFYQVENHERGFIRAWHGHKKEGKYVYVPKGSALIGVIGMEEDEAVDTYTLSDVNPRILFIPPGNYNGFKTLEENTILFFFSTVTLKESAGDDFRIPYDDYPILNTEYR